MRSTASGVLEAPCQIDTRHRTPVAGAAATNALAGSMKSSVGRGSARLSIAGSDEPSYNKMHAGTLTSLKTYKARLEDLQS